jgi:hypothetical protein
MEKKDERKPIPDKDGWDMSVARFKEIEPATLAIGELLSDIFSATKTPVLEGTCACMMMTFTSLAAAGASPKQLIDWIMTGCALYVKTIAILEQDAAADLVADLLEKLKKGERK